MDGSNVVNFEETGEIFGDFAKIPIGNFALLQPKKKFRNGQKILMDTK